jgi:peptide-methionine (S)-S-oxide reductase
MKSIAAYLLIMMVGVSCAQQKNKTTTTIDMKDGLMLATFGSGCFWCTEAVFQRVNGVEQVVSGYMGGRVKNPSYKEVTTGQTGHAEVIQLTYDQGKVSFDELLEIFWGTHDPTTLNRQGADVGTQYRSVVFYHSEEQKALTES